jgi:hypothetical protein
LRGRLMLTKRAQGDMAGEASFERHRRLLEVMPLVPGGVESRSRFLFRRMVRGSSRWSFWRLYCVSG